MFKYVNFILRTLHTTYQASCYHSAALILLDFSCTSCSLHVLIQVHTFYVQGIVLFIPLQSCVVPLRLSALNYTSSYAYPYIKFITHSYNIHACIDPKLITLQRRSITMRFKIINAYQRRSPHSPISSARTSMKRCRSWNRVFAVAFENYPLLYLRFSGFCEQKDNKNLQTRAIKPEFCLS